MYVGNLDLWTLLQVRYVGTLKLANLKRIESIFLATETIQRTHTFSFNDYHLVHYSFFLIIHIFLLLFIIISHDSSSEKLCLPL